MLTETDRDSADLSPSDKCALTNIRCRAGELVRDGYVHLNEVEDFTHDLFCEYLRRMRHYDPNRGSPATYINWILRKQTATWLRKRRRKQITTCNENQTLIDAVNDEEALIQRLTIQSIVQDLPIHQQVLVRHLSEHSITQASELMGKSRTWVYQQIAEVRAVFESKGFSRRSREAQPLSEAAGRRRIA